MPCIGHLAGVTLLISIPPFYITAHNDHHLQRLPAACAQSWGALTLKHHQSLRGISEETKALQPLSSCRLPLYSLSPPCVKQAKAAAHHEGKTAVGGRRWWVEAAGGLVHGLHWISVHSWAGGEKRAKSHQKTAALHSFLSMNWRQTAFTASVSDLTGYMTLGKMTFGKYVGRDKKKKDPNTTPFQKL